MRDRLQKCLATENTLQSAISSDEILFQSNLEIPLVYVAPMSGGAPSVLEIIPDSLLFLSLPPLEFIVQLVDATFGLADCIF